MTRTIDVRAAVLPQSARTATIARLAALVIALIATAIGAVIVVQLAIATGEYEQAQAIRLEQSLRLSESETALASTTAQASTGVEVADAALGAAPTGYVSAEATAALTSSRDILAAVLDAAETAKLNLPDDPSVSLDAAALHAATDELLDQAALAHDAVTEQHSVAAAIVQAEASNRDAGAGLLASASAVASTVLPANPSTANLPHIEFLRTLDELATQQQLDESAVATLAEYVKASDAVRASHAAEEAEKAGPLYGLRAEVEAYARSLSGGVLLDFNWAPIVIGYSMAGTATIEGSGSDYLYSTITLTNSIASNWGSTVPVALVTHEVGHAITSKCWDQFDAAFGGNYEQWATAWAMSWGFPAGPSGADSYGTPTPDQVAIAGTCR